MDDEEILADAEITLAELKSYFKPGYWEKFLALMQEGRDLQYSVVKIVIVDRRVDSLRLEKLVK